MEGMINISILFIMASLIFFSQQEVRNPVFIAKI